MVSTILEVIKVINLTFILIIFSILNISNEQKVNMSKYGLDDKLFKIEYSTSKISINANFEKNSQKYEINLELKKLFENISQNDLLENVVINTNISGMQVINFWDINTSYFSINLPQNDRFKSGILNMYIYNKEGVIGTKEKFNVNRGDVNIRIYLENINNCICIEDKTNENLLNVNTISADKDNVINPCCISNQNNSNSSNEITLDFDYSIKKLTTDDINEEASNDYFILPKYYRNSTNWNQIESNYDRNINQGKLSFTFKGIHDFIIYDFIIKSNTKFIQIPILLFMMLFIIF